MLPLHPGGYSLGEKWVYLSNLLTDLKFVFSYQQEPPPVRFISMHTAALVASY